MQRLDFPNYNYFNITFGSKYTFLKTFEFLMTPGTKPGNKAEGFVWSGNNSDKKYSKRIDKNQVLLKRKSSDYLI
jgi:hypothetical protein